MNIRFGVIASALYFLITATTAWSTDSSNNGRYFDHISKDDLYPLQTTSEGTPAEKITTAGLALGKKLIKLHKKNALSRAILTKHWAENTGNKSLKEEHLNAAIAIIADFMLAMHVCLNRLLGTENHKKANIATIKHYWKALISSNSVIPYVYLNTQKVVNYLTENVNTEDHAHLIESAIAEKNRALADEWFAVWQLRKLFRFRLTFLYGEKPATLA